MDVNTQFLLFIVCLLIGMVITTTFSIYMIIIRRYNITGVLRVIFDIILAIIFASLTFQIIYKINFGIIPFYCYIIIFIGILSGRYLIFKNFEKQVINTLLIVEILYSKLLRLLKWLIIEPYKKIYLLLNDIFEHYEPTIHNKIGRQRRRWREWIERRKTEKEEGS